MDDPGLCFYLEYQNSIIKNINSKAIQSSPAEKKNPWQKFLFLRPEVFEDGWVSLL